MPAWLSDRTGLHPAVAGVPDAHVRATWLYRRSRPARPGGARARLGLCRPLDGRQGHGRRARSWTPFAKASELAITSRSEGRIALAGGYGSHCEPVRCVRRTSGEIAVLWLSGTKLVPEDELAAEMLARYGNRKPVKRRRRQRASPRTAP